MHTHPILERPVQYIKGVGPKRAELLAKKWGIATLRQLIELVPRTYRDYSQFRAIGQLVPGDEEVTVRGRVESHHEKRPRHGLTISTVLITDGTGFAAGSWFNQPWVAKSLTPGMSVIFSGRPQRRGGYWEFQNPEYEVEDEDRDPIHAGRIVPVYPLTERLGPREMRRLMKEAVEAGAAAMPQLVPEPARRRCGLLPAGEAWRAIHFPETDEQRQAARTTLAFQELFVLQTALLRQKRRVAQERGIAHQPEGELSRRFRASLPFPLTSAQLRVIAQIGTDMESTRPMSRLVQGDVGSGKTVVAAAALIRAVESGHQGVLMAPTEILAEQHFANLRRLFEPLGVTVVLLTGRQGKKDRETALRALQSGFAQVAVGTHALLEDWVEFRDLSLVITDEQHRFGVQQRATLRAKGLNPDVLVMTATPIPRTLALTLYGDLDVSIIDELPPGRKPISTHWVKPAQRRKVYDRAVERFISQGQQGYVIAPLVEESDRSQARAATELQEELSHWYPQLRIGLLHGRMKSDEKDAVMEAFRKGELHILVATTVVEVGVDVPNASFIIIEEADRFGLSQLHQLRGRVGRGPHESYCILIADEKTEEGYKRLKALENHTSGFKISEIDLEIRGPGQLTGLLQSGYVRDALFKVANPVTDLPLLERARAEAERLVEADPLLAREEHRALRAEILDRLPGMAEGLAVG